MNDFLTQYQSVLTQLSDAYENSGNSAKAIILLDTIEFFRRNQTIVSSGYSNSPKWFKREVDDIYQNMNHPKGLVDYVPDCFDEKNAHEFYEMLAAVSNCIDRWKKI